jgi:putative spermidine/putrescine transport system ATP-binding protein
MASRGDPSTVSGGGSLTLEGLSKSYGQTPVVSGIDLAIRPGEFVTLLGPSGCGKTTILRMVAGLIPPTAGRILVDGADISALPTHRRNMGLVFQNYALFPHMDVAGNVAFGLEMRGVNRAETAARVRAVLDLVRLGDFGERRPRALSGGQQQRVALARALVVRPAVLLLDEPLSNLDAKLREDLRDEIRAIQERLHTTTLFVTHDQAEALTMSDRVVVLTAGRIEQVGTPVEIYDQPASPFVATFIGRVNRLNATVAASDGTGCTVAAPGLRGRSLRLLPAGARVQAMVRPQRITLASGHAEGENRLVGTVRRVVFAGDIVQVEVETEAGMLTVEQPRRGLAAGDAVTACWEAADMMLFPA